MRSCLIDVAARASPSPGERAEGAVSLDQGRDLPADSGGWLRHCNRQRCAEGGKPSSLKSGTPNAGDGRARRIENYHCGEFSVQPISGARAPVCPDSDPDVRAIRQDINKSINTAGPDPQAGRGITKSKVVQRW